MGWSEMLPELLDIIAQKHNVFYEDYLSFAGVCRSWQSAAKLSAHNYPNGPPSRLPCLMLADKNEEYVREKYCLSETVFPKLLQQLSALTLAEKKEDDVRELFFLSNETIRKVRLPEISGKLCLSSCGWLLTVGEGYTSKLVHPLTCEIVNLPSICTFPELEEDSKWYGGLTKLVLVVPSSLVVVLWGCSGKVGFCRPRDNMWTAVLEGWAGQIFDITYHNGRVYSFDCNYHIRACDVEGKNPTIMVDVSRLPADVYNEWLGGAYILGLENHELLVVIREGLDDNVDDLRSEIYKTMGFRVFKYDLESENWSEVKDLGTKALFVGYSSSFWMEADNTGVIKGNCIYYTDDVCELYAGSIKGGGRDMGIYCLSDGTIEPHFTEESRSHISPPMWLQPCLVSKLTSLKDGKQLITFGAKDEHSKA